MWPDTSRPPDRREEDCPLSGERMRHAAPAENTPFRSPVPGTRPARPTGVAGTGRGRFSCRAPPGRACRHGSGQATERGSKSHISLRSVHNEVEENRRGIAARK
jgi:hypothetical protein